MLRVFRIPTVFLALVLATGDLHAFAPSPRNRRELPGLSDCRFREETLVRALLSARRSISRVMTVSLGSLFRRVQSPDSGKIHHRGSRIAVFGLLGHAAAGLANAQSLGSSIVLPQTDVLVGGAIILLVVVALFFPRAGQRLIQGVFWTAWRALACCAAIRGSLYVMDHPAIISNLDELARQGAQTGWDILNQLQAFDNRLASPGEWLLPALTGIAVFTGVLRIGLAFMPKKKAKDPFRDDTRSSSTDQPSPPAPGRGG